MKIAVMIDAGVPKEPRPAREEGYKKDCPSIEEEVRSIIDLIESGHDSHVEWRALKKFYKVLCCAKKTDKVLNLKNMIEPILAKYGHPV